jgi:pilus assembly protein Flp/PilA
MLRRFFSDESGLETVEYAVMGALVVGATLVAITGLGTAVQGRLNELATTIG